MCARDPERIAVLTREVALSYRELDEWAGAIAGNLLDRLDRGCEAVPLVAAQGPWAIAATLGILKAGKFYVPLDPSWDLRRIGDVLAELSARVVLAGDEFAPMLREHFDNDVIVEPARHPRDTWAGPHTPVESVAPDQPAYVYFTSGSTGRPKVQHVRRAAQRRDLLPDRSAG